MKKRCILLVFVYTLFLAELRCASYCTIEERTEKGQVRYILKNSPFRKGPVHHGEYTIWYPDGKKKYVINYHNGHKHGRETLWNEWGVKLRETNYKNDVKSGKEIF